MRCSCFIYQQPLSSDFIVLLYPAVQLVRVRFVSCVLIFHLGEWPFKRSRLHWKNDMRCNIVRSYAYIAKSRLFSVSGDLLHESGVRGSPML